MEAKHGIRFLHEIFEPDLIKEIEFNGEFLTLKAGETLIKPGQIARIMPLVIRGLLKVTRIDEEGKELMLYYIGERETCAMSFVCCMERLKSEVKVTAEEDTEILALPIHVMDRWMMQYATWKNFVMKTIHARFTEMLKTIDLIAFQRLDERLVSYLKEKSKTSGSSLINLSHEQIAIDLATSRVVISRLLKKLENEGQLLLYRNQIKLLKEL